VSFGTVACNQYFNLLPEDPESRKFWGEIAEEPSGADVDAAHHWFRMKLVEIIANFRANLLVFDGNHAEFFDNLKGGILLAIPLLSPTKLAKWKPKELVLFIPSRMDIMRLFAAFSSGENGSTKLFGFVLSLPATVTSIACALS